MSCEMEKLVPSQDLKECSICARLFALERINTHEIICQESSSIQRKSFNIAEQRTRGTGADKLAKAAAQDPMLQRSGPCGLSTNWRGKHEDCLKMINEAKRRSAENSDNKKINDLPFPPPERETDYVKCQHCLKQFNEASALRHIAICASKMPDSTKNFPSD